MLKRIWTFISKNKSPEAKNTEVLLKNALDSKPNSEITIIKKFVDDELANIQAITDENEKLKKLKDLLVILNDRILRQYELEFTAPSLLETGVISLKILWHRKIHGDLTRLVDEIKPDSDLLEILEIQRDKVRAYSDNIFFDKKMSISHNSNAL